MANKTSLSINYQGSTKQPTIDQIQPLRQNTDPLNVEVGNPNLKQEFRNSINANFNDYKVISGRYIWAGGGFTFTDNAISTSQNTYAGTGIRTYRYINVDGNYNSWGYAGYSMSIRKLDVNASANINYNLGHTTGYVNGVKNISNNNAYTFGLDINYDKEKKISLAFRPDITYNDNRSTISTFNAGYWTSNNSFDGSYNFPKKFEAGTTISWMLRQRTQIFTGNNNVFLWNLYVSKKFLKRDRLEVRATAYDILNQNIGFNRSAQDNIITQSDYNSIRRHAIFSLIWNFTKSPAAAVAPNNN